MSAAATPLRAFSALEALIWLLLFATAFLVAQDTWLSDFPARTRALGGEALVLALSAGFAVFAARRVVRAADQDEANQAEANQPEAIKSAVPLLALVLLAFRVFLLVPAVTFFLLVAAAGFAA